MASKKSESEKYDIHELSQLMEKIQLELIQFTDIKSFVIIPINEK